VKAIDHPDENQSGRTRGAQSDMWARPGRNTPPPVRGSKPAKGKENPGAPPGEKL